jgi:uncharacterized protein YcgI (DUF1989 family)
MNQEALEVLPARRGKAVRLDKGQSLTIINTHGSQVVDCWAFSAADPDEAMSMMHSRHAWYRIFPRSGDAFVTTRRRPILTLAEDRSPGRHDTLIPCCDTARYEQLGHSGHDNCADNLSNALAELGLSAPAQPPAPLNLFMNIPVTLEGDLSAEPPLSKAGDSVTLEAVMDCIVALSACPHDILPINGPDCEPRDVQYRIEG